MTDDAPIAPTSCVFCAKPAEVGMSWLIDIGRSTERRQYVQLCNEHAAEAWNHRSMGPRTKETVIIEDMRDSVQP